MSGQSHIHIYFCFSSCKNCNIGVARLVAGEAGYTYVFLLFQSQKLKPWGSSFVRLIARIYFRFSTHKNCKTRAAITEAG